MTFDRTHREDLPNAIMMNNLHVAPLLSLLQRRLKKEKIYTYAADVLISVNPYKVGRAGVCDGAAATVVVL